MTFDTHNQNTNAAPANVFDKPGDVAFRITMQKTNNSGKK
jgi:hypothetical protein